MNLARRWQALRNMNPDAHLLIVPIICAVGMILLVFLAGRFEREFRLNLEQGFQQRVELGDLASSVQQLRYAVEYPRVLDGHYVVSLTERAQEAEQKLKAHSLQARIADLSLPSKELATIVSYKTGFERLSATALQIEKVQSLQSNLRPQELADGSAIKRVSQLVGEYAQAAGALRGSRGGQQSVAQLANASLGLGENLQAALIEVKRKGVPQAWRDAFSAFPVAPADFVDRLLADARLLEDLQAQRTRVMGRLEQASAKIASAERLLLGANADGGLLVASKLLTAAGLALGVLGLLWSIYKLRQQSKQVVGDQQRVPPFSEPSSELAKVESVDFSETSETLERAIAARVSQAAGLGNSSYAPMVASDSSLDTELDDEVTSGYWIASGSMSERRVALLDKQSAQLELHVKSVLAAAESLAGRADLLVQNLQLVRDEHGQSRSNADANAIRARTDELQSIAINLSLQIASGENPEPVLNDLERFNDELDSLAEDIQLIGDHQNASAFKRRIASTIDEGRRMIAAADTLKERTETLYEDAQRFRRHSEALIKGIQDGAVSEVPLRLVRDLRSVD